MQFPKRSAALVVSAFFAGMIWLHHVDYHPLIRALGSTTVTEFEYQIHADHDGVDLNMAFGRSVEVTVEGEEAQTVYQDADLMIEAFRDDHPDWIFAYGYRIRHEDKTIAISGDTKISEGIRNHARDADLLIHEAMIESLMSLISDALARTNSPIHAARLQRIADVHSLTLPLADLADLAEEVGAKPLVLTHLYTRDRLTKVQV